MKGHVYQRQCSWYGFSTSCHMALFRRLKHWQIFLLVVGIPVILQFLQGVTYFSTHRQMEDTTFPIIQLLLFLPIMTYYGWIGAVGFGLGQKNTAARMPLAKFRLSLWASFLATASLLLFTFYRNLTDERFFPLLPIAIALFLSLFTLFYCLSFMARAIVQAERGTRVKAAEFYSEFVMAVAFPIGIWLLQPRINRLNAF